MAEWTGEWHPFAERFSMLGEEELRDLAESIKTDGQLHPCLMDPDGLGLDGRNRVAACRIAGVEPEWVVAAGKPRSTILAANVRRRQITLGQQAMAVALDLDESGQRVRGRFRRGAVPEAPDDNARSRDNRGWQWAVQKAGVVLDWLPHLAEDVMAGTLALDNAHQQARQKRDEETTNAEKVGRLPEDLAALVEAGVRDLDDALAEVGHRATVVEVDKQRNADGAPPPSFAQRVADGAVSWKEAASLAEEWREEREESIKRDQERLRDLNVAWRVIRNVAANPERPYTADVLAGLGQADRDALQRIISETGVAS